MRYRAKDQNVYLKKYAHDNRQSLAIFTFSANRCDYRKQNFARRRDFEHSASTTPRTKIGLQLTETQVASLFKSTEKVV